MRFRRVLIAVVLVVVAATLQTTLFVNLRPFDTAPALVILTVIAITRHLQAEVALGLGFLGGLIEDLLADSPLGLWALVVTTVAYVTVRARSRFEDDPTLMIPAVLILTFGALALFSVLGTIFGEKTLADAGILRKMLLPAIYNTALALAVMPGVTVLLGSGRRGSLEFDL